MANKPPLPTRREFTARQSQKIGALVAAAAQAISARDNYISGLIDGMGHDADTENPHVQPGPDGRWFVEFAPAPVLNGEAVSIDGLATAN